ncbi:Exocyst complex protein EXO70 [Spathaspora sp. JA1]|nr:Exocyst complex protein EXO70 [Spathaspora sp. JA1]
MPYKVDIDEADVAVLNQNLIKSKDLFQSMNSSLIKIADKSTSASSTIKPVLKQVNKLTKSKIDVDKGLNLLSDVSKHAATINEFDNILSSPIDVIGLVKYVNTLKSSKQMYNEIKPKFKQFHGILLNFEKLIDNSTLKLQTYFQMLINQDSTTLIHENSHQIKDIKFIFGYFENDQYVQKLYIRSRTGILTKNMKPLSTETQIKRQSNIPYERGSNGIGKYVDLLIQLIEGEIILLNKLGLSDFLVNITRDTINELISIMNSYTRFFENPKTVIDNYILALEILDNLVKFQQFLQDIGSENQDFSLQFQAYIQKNQIIFREFIKTIEVRFQQFDKFTDTHIPEIVVDLMSKLRKLSEFHQSLLILISEYKLGDWLVITPPVRFLSVYTSVIPNTSQNQSTEYLLSSFYSDVIDSIMVNIEIGLKNTDNPKSTQGFILIKNLIMIESIINRSNILFSSLGNLGIERVNKLKNRFLKFFLDDWNHASYIIIRDMTMIATQNPHGTNIGTGGVAQQLSTKEREQVKELFKNFNESFEEAISNYQKYNFGDLDLKNFLGNEIKKLIRNAYFKLYDKYGSSDFTKNRQKYVKYDKNQFEKLLNEKL